jgi:hypothetical protein
MSDNCLLAESQFMNVIRAITEADGAEPDESDPTNCN